MKALITGANGMVARAAIIHFGASNDEVIPLTKSELDISNRQEVVETVEDLKPDAIINCAAYTDVDGAESNPTLSKSVNAIGVENLAVASKTIGCKFLTISTDFVFDGEKGEKYTQNDVPNPINVYGETKLLGEVLARKAYPQSIIVRAGWIFGFDGNNFLSEMPVLLRSGKTVGAISDCYGTPTYAPDLVRRLRELLVVNIPGVYHVSNTTENMSFYEFAERICEIEGIDRNLVKEISTDDLNRPARRPRSSGLRCLKSGKVGLSPLPGIDKALDRFLQTK